MTDKYNTPTLFISTVFLLFNRNAALRCSGNAILFMLPYRILPYLNLCRLQRQPNIQIPFWAREFAVAHKNIDDDATGSPGGKVGQSRRLTVLTVPPADPDLWGDDDEEE